MITPENNINSLFDKSIGTLRESRKENPNVRFSHDLKKNVGPIKYRNISKKIDITGNRSKKKLKNRNSATKKIDPGKPKKIKVLVRVIKKSLGHKKLRPLISVINRVLKRRATASTNKNEFVDNKAWLMSIQKLDIIKFDCPLIIHIVSQCISITVE